MPKNNHDPRRLADYLDIHETWMERLRREHFVLEDDLAIDANLVAGVPHLLMKGRIRCAGGIFVDVRKTLRVLGGADEDAMVQTIAYTYHARVGGLGDILRYCSPHTDHNQFHHRHSFDPFADRPLHTLDEEPSTCEPTSETDWPTLGNVLHELRDWYFDNIAALYASAD